jgi:hypothetical protein
MGMKDKIFKTGDLVYFNEDDEQWPYKMFPELLFGIFVRPAVTDDLMAYTNGQMDSSIKIGEYCMICWHYDGKNETWPARYDDIKLVEVKNEKSSKEDM